MSIDVIIAVAVSLLIVIVLIRLSQLEEALERNTENLYADVVNGLSHYLDILFEQGIINYPPEIKEEDRRLYKYQQLLLIIPRAKNFTCFTPEEDLDYDEI